MIRVGCHLSIAGGFRMAARSACRLGCEALQVFSRSPRGGNAKPLDPIDVAEFRALLSANDVAPCVVHVPYYVDIATADKEAVLYTREIVASDMARAGELGAAYVVAHVGHAGAADPILQVVSMLDAILSDVSENGVMLLLENTAGQGKEIGSAFADIAEIIARTKNPDRLGCCFDTCHAFASGYDIASEMGMASVVRELRSTIGFDKIRVIHANDSKGQLGSHKDRHEEIGAGQIGENGFSLVLSVPELQHATAILETPFNSDDDVLRNLGALKRLRPS